jgi:signal transduction histidine kinase
MNLFTLTQPLRDRRWFGYGFGLGALLVSLAIRVALGDIALRFPFVIFIPTVVLTTFLGGVRPGIAAAIAAGLITDLTLIAPPGSVWPRWPTGWIAMGFYALTVGIDVALIQGMIAACRRADAAEHALRLLNADLERRVAERTAALETEVTERTNAEAQLRQLQKMESVGQLTGGIAHDFNNMLAVIIGSLELARRRADDPVQLGTYLDRAEKGARRAAQLTGRLLAFSRQQSLAPSVLDANRLIAGMADLLHRSLGETIGFETSLAPGLWPTFADAGQVENAIVNLAVNARDAMPAGGRVTITTRNHDLDAPGINAHAEVQPGQYVEVAVTDTGTGMPPHVIERAFDPFFTTKAIGKGTGLGLSQVYGFVRQSGGHVAITSQPGHGTTVRLYLPRYEGPAEDAADDAATRRDDPADATPGPSLSPGPNLSPGLGLGPDAGPYAHRGETVLVVEDKADVRAMSIDALLGLGYAVLQAEDADQALDILAAHPEIDLMFTDVVMPGMDGRQLAIEAKRRRPGLGILFTTGFAPNSGAQGGSQALPFEVLAKPYTIAQLERKLHEVLARVRVTALEFR